MSVGKQQRGSGIVTCADSGNVSIGQFLAVRLLLSYGIHAGITVSHCENLGWFRYSAYAAPGIRPFFVYRVLPSELLIENIIGVGFRILLALGRTKQYCIFFIGIIFFAGIIIIYEINKITVDTGCGFITGGETGNTVSGIIIYVMHIHHARMTQIIDAAYGFCPFPRFVQCRQQHRRQYGDDRNNDQQFNQCK